MDISKYLDLYLTESAEHLSKMREGLPREGPIAVESVQELFRHAHSLKGMAASMGFDQTGQLAHRLESLLGRWRDGAAATEAQRRAATRAIDTLDALMDAVRVDSSDAALAPQVRSALEALQLALEPGGPAEPPRPPGATAVPAPAPEAPDTFTAKLTVSIDPSSPLPVARLLVVAQRIKQESGDYRMSPDLETLKRENRRTASFRVAGSPGLKDLARSLKALPDVAEVSLDAEEARPAAAQETVLVRSVRVQSSDLDTLLAETSELLYDLNQFEAGLSPPERRHHHFWLEAHRSHLNRLFDQVLSVRLVSFELLAERLGRTVREISDKLGKRIGFEASGTDQRVDRSFLERLLDPLVHLIRNAIDHGIESFPERNAAGKPLEGKIRMEVRREAESLLVTLTDDGRGVDVEAIRQAAIEKGLYGALEAALLDRARLLEILTTPAFSTRKEVTEVSGRGVGLDVVRSAVESMGGYLEMDSEWGKGTRFTLVIPSAVTLTRVLVFGWEDGIRYGLPTSQIHHIYPLANYPLVWTGNHRQLQVEDVLLPVLSWKPGPVGREGFALRLLSPDGDKVLLVSTIYQAERVVILPWGPPLEMMPEWMGGALLSTGEIAYILDGRAVAKREGESIHVLQNR